MDKHVSRRGFLKSGAVALGALAACDVVVSAAPVGGAKPVDSDDAKERAMPHIIIKMYPGRTEQQKKQLTDAIVKDVVTYARVGENSISVAIEEISPGEWTEKVYKPDIQKNWDKLYKKPNY